ncbi:hypothetical protein Pint_04854 [Pistacia integerrima]|uniref:Uncharacterized protein n=1 Tax=Pistacia integerrima TaxID=434235 RepID=A0ACC0Z0H0_9ROSI|nr:hypothetical protein Pint_04854 [Pistacia integerrima]
MLSEPVDNEIIRSSLSVCNEIKAFEKEPGTREKIDGFLKDFEDLEKSFESIDELLVVQEKMGNLKNSALMRLSDYLCSKVFASGYFGNNLVDKIDFSNGIRSALASEFSHLDEILMNDDTNSVFNGNYTGETGNNSFYNGNANVGINNASISNVFYPDGNCVSGDEINHINQEAESGAITKSLSNPEIDFNQGASENAC